MVRSAIVAVLFAWGILIGVSIAGFVFTEVQEPAPAFALYEPPPRELTVPLPVNLTNVSTASMRVPAVDQEGRGVSTILTVQVVPGSGRSLANIDNIFFFMDTQNSIRTAKHVAEDITGEDMGKLDVIYTIAAEASVIEGPSAGAALAIATIAAIEKEGLDTSVMITGTVNEQGVIGPVGGILEKAKAAKAIGAGLFLVPQNQGTSTTYETQRTCETIGSREICTVEQVPVKADISAEAGIEIREVRTIEEAMGYFF